MNDMGGGFFEITWLVIFAIVIIAIIWIVKSDKKKKKKALADARRKWERGEITETEYKKLVKEIMGG